ncbi:hypothetical protein L6Q21_09405 [Sandaracinobacter sp. RS1-74]|uniref:hypothetical protein n=1 Tax=Sandaracinobacteroides sayramensis TaxID=2913411 RepID=UPI001EDB3398|nr:hypothetical protein [Sandaracinobacteroides sayramensis]MCG2841195.1 hypothetical protein [Sandaracinobacteroides sayramensis]
MVAEACGLSNAGLQAVLGDRFDALAAFQDKVADEAALAAVSAGSVQERLFDGIMQGFDHLQAHRAAVLAIRSSRDPGIALLVVCRAGLQIRRLARASGMDLAGARGPLKLAALTALIWQAFAAWRADDSPDMAATMASLDQLLERAERAETEGLSPDLIGLPGLTALFARLRPCGGQSGPVLPPSPGQQAE